ncbi:hypothetical protein CLCR_10972 [Cladophialophora carrionii]|uniref:Uncharacterized protein n=1 Tax=Cladophialophora carrionii TaxID=86049 RepID=A0A1C1CV27_9EURO|nr:hypothetical protein CLCR_10972 [Cladophialophora carrionii]
MDFDFAACLARLDPTYEYHIDKLAGGVVNVTVRATKVGFASTSARLPIPQRHENLKMGDGDLEPGHGRFADQKTLILKHAPPFIAGVGTDAPMSQERQVHSSPAGSFLWLVAQRQADDRSCRPSFIPPSLCAQERIAANVGRA